MWRSAQWFSFLVKKEEIRNEWSFLNFSEFVKLRVSLELTYKESSVLRHAREWECGTGRTVEGWDGPYRNFLQGYLYQLSNGFNFSAEFSTLLQSSQLPTCWARGQYRHFNNVLERSHTRYIIMFHSTSSIHMFHHNFALVFVFDLGILSTRKPHSRAAVLITAQPITA